MMETNLPFLVIAIIQIEQLLPSQGIYRVNGNAEDVQLLKQQIDNNDFKELQKCISINTIASTVKLYIRELPLSPISKGCAMKIDHIVKGDAEGKHKEVANLINSETTYDNIKILKYLLEHLNKITKDERCKMDAKNLAICWSSNIIEFVECEKRTRMEMISEVGSFHLVTEWLIKEIEELDLNSD